MSLDIAIAARIKLQFREILTGSAKYQCIDGCFCENVFNIVIVTVTYELPSYTVRRMGIFASNVDACGGDDLV